MRKIALCLFAATAILLVGTGMLVLSSAGCANALRIHNNVYHFIINQAKFLAVALVACATIAAIDYRVLRRNLWLPILAYAGIFILLIVVFKCRPINGSRRWIPIFGKFNLQPSELAKIAIVVLLAVYYDILEWRSQYLRYTIFIPLIAIALYSGPISQEKDFGNATVVALTGLLVMFLSDANLWFFLTSFFLGVGGLFWYAKSDPNRMARVFAWNPHLQELLAGSVATVSDKAAEAAVHQGRMALVAISRGGISGVGLGESMQKLYYLPEAHTDFVFAVGAEEGGLFFSAAVIFLFLAFFILAAYIAYHAHDRLGRNLVMGMAFIIFMPAMINLGVVSGLFPTKGMALPFFSYGGTNLVCAFIAVGIILSVGIHSLHPAKKDLPARTRKGARN